MGNVSEVTFQIVPDPRQQVTAQDWAEQQDLMARIEGHIAEMHGCVNAVRKVRKQVESFNEAFSKTEGEAAQALTASGKDLIKKIDSWEAEVVETRQRNFQDVINWPSKLNAEFFDLRSKLDVHDPRVTQGVRDRLADLEAEWTARHAAWKKLIDEDVKGYNRMFKEKDLPALALPGE